MGWGLGMMFDPHIIAYWADVHPWLTDVFFHVYIHDTNSISGASYVCKYWQNLVDWLQFAKFPRHIENTQCIQGTKHIY